MTSRQTTVKPKFELRFDYRALDEWRKLDSPIKDQFKKKLSKLISSEETPSPKNRVSGLPPGFYKIKQRSSGYRLVYKYEDAALVIFVIAVGKRNRNIVYEAARIRVGKQ